MVSKEKTLTPVARRSRLSLPRCASEYVANLELYQQAYEILSHCLTCRKRILRGFTHISLFIFHDEDRNREGNKKSDGILLQAFIPNLGASCSTKRALGGFLGIIGLPKK